MRVKDIAGSNPLLPLKETGSPYRHNMNKVFIVGRLGKDAVINDANGKKVMNYSVGVSTGTKENPSTSWWDCSQWSEKTGVAAYLTKGTQVAVMGEPGLRTYQKNDGTAGASLTCRVDKVELLGSKTNEAAPAPSVTSEPAEDLPF